MGYPLGPLLANVFMCSTEENLEQHGQLARHYWRYVDDTLTAGQFLLIPLTLPILPSRFTMEIERGKDPFPF